MKRIIICCFLAACPIICRAQWINRVYFNHRITPEDVELLEEQVAQGKLDAMLALATVMFAAVGINNVVFDTDSSTATLVAVEVFGELENRVEFTEVYHKKVL